MGKTIFKQFYGHEIVNENYTSYIASIRMFSNVDRNPRAPVFLANAFLAIIRKALSVKCNFTWNTVSCNMITLLEESIVDVEK